MPKDACLPTKNLGTDLYLQYLGPCDRFLMHPVEGCNLGTWDIR